jgi:hypothetical protein
MQLAVDEKFAYQPVSVSKARIWTGRILSGLLVLFFIFDVVGKFAKPAPVVEAFAHLAVPIYPRPCHRGHPAGLYHPLRDSAHCNFGCGATDRLSGRRGAYLVTRR